MTTIYEAALAAKKDSARNVSELAELDLQKMEVVHRIKGRDDGSTYEYDCVVVDGEDYRVPKGVLIDLKALLETEPDIRRVRILRTGTTQNDTRYTVIPRV